MLRKGVTICTEVKLCHIFLLSCSLKIVISLYLHLDFIISTT